MRLAISGKGTEIQDRDGVKMGMADFGGIVKQICLLYTPEVQPGDDVLAQVGFALNKMDEEAASRTYQILERPGQLDELRVPDMQLSARADQKKRKG